MPIVEKSPYTLPHLVYDAPVNEKTQKIRELFKVDEATGYPEHYNWRGMSRLGPKYNYEDPFNKLDPSGPDDHYSQKVVITGGIIVMSALAHCYVAYASRRPLWARLYVPAALMYGGIKVGFWLQEKTIERQRKRNGIILDYARKHPERFGAIERPKLREVLYPFAPIR